MQANELPQLPKWDYNQAQLIETQDIHGIVRRLYKLPDIVQIHSQDSPVFFYHYEPKNITSQRGIFISYAVLGGELKYENNKYKFVGGEEAQYMAWYGTKVLGMHSIVVVTDNNLLFNPLLNPNGVRLEIMNVYFNHLQMQDFLMNSGLFKTMDWEDVHHVGMSLGALTAIIVAGLSQRYATLTAVVGGAPFSEIFAYSDEQPVKDYFTGAMKNFNKTREELITWLEKGLKVFDTHEASALLKKERIYLVLGLFDDAVPNNLLRPKVPKTGFKLKKFANDPKTDVFPTNHRGIILGVPIWLPRMSMHIKKWAKKR
jgi:hypothetical protein